MFKLIGHFSFPYSFTVKKDGKDVLLTGTSYKFEFFHPQIAGTIKVKVREETYSHYEDYLNNPNTSYIFGLNKDGNLYLKSVI